MILFPFAAQATEPAPGLIHQPKFFALYKETPMAFRIKPAGASGSRVCGMAANLPTEAAFGFWGAFLFEAKAGRSFLFFLFPGGETPPAGNFNKTAPVKGRLRGARR